MVTDPRDLHARIHLFSRAPCPATDPGLAPKRVLLVPWMRPVELAFPIAQALLDGGEPGVRIVATAAPLESAWPEWTRTRPGLVMTEIGAYRARSRIASTRDLRADVRRWLDRLLTPFGELERPSRAFYGAACLRVFEPAIDVHPFIRGLAAGLAGCDVSCVEPWVAQPVLDALLRPSGGRCTAPEHKAKRTIPWRAEMAARTAAYGAGALVEMTRAYIAAAPSLDLIESTRTAVSGEPDLWVTLIPTWFRMNRHVLQSVVEPSSKRGMKLGAMLFGELGRGERVEHDLKRLQGDSLWPGLRESRAALLRGAVEQVAVPGSTRELGRALALAVERSARASWRLITGPRTIKLGDHEIDIETRLAEIAKLATVDVVRATFADVATRAVVSKHALGGAPVVMASTSMSETAIVDAILNDAGAITIDFTHGTQGDGWASFENTSTVRVVWAQSDVDALAPTGQRCIVAGMPKPTLPPRQGPRRGRRVLITSAYLHRDGRVRGLNPYTLVQHELLSIVDTFARDPRLLKPTFRWRPHPADEPDKLEKMLEAHAPMELSKGTLLADDLAWCDVVVSTPSSVVFEALFADVPVFLQAHPELWGTPVTEYLDPKRVFYWAADGVPALRASLARLDAGDESELAPERAARVRLFGPTGEPRSVSDALCEIRGVGSETTRAAGATKTNGIGATRT